ncbi:protein of unknown function [Enterobacter cancerogenus]|nr:protein of unknown function [Enterobacter cancerogenus]
MQVPDVIVDMKVISALDVPVIVALAIPENKSAETDSAIKVELNFIVVLRKSARFIRR